MKRGATVLTLFLVLLPFMGAAHAQEPGQVTLETVIQKEIEVITPEGEKETKLVEAGNAIPGDELIFTISYTNRGLEPAENVVVVNPIPEHTAYIGGSSEGEGAAISFSVDGGNSYDQPGNLLVPGEDGKPRPAQASEYTHIRWAFGEPVLPGGSGKVFFRVRLR
jgi:uncharacterized repeat protein (TIGR01451 family)